jgi:hypothetical protein
MTLQGKVTTYNYYSGLEKLTDNMGLEKVRVCFQCGFAGELKLK